MIDKVKDLSKIVVRGDMLLVKLFDKKSKSGLILEGSDAIDYLEVIAVGYKIEDVNVGDIVLDLDVKEINTFELEGIRYARISRNLCGFITSRDNIDFDKK